MGLKDLPGSGSKFRATAGTSSFQKKLKIAAGHGYLNVLDEKQQEAIINEAKKDEIKIRRGQFTPLQQKRALSRVMANDPTATELDRIRIREVLKRLGPNGAESTKKSKEEGKMVEINGRKVYLTPEQIARNLKNRAQLDDYGIRGNELYKTRYAGGIVETKSLGGSTSVSGGVKVKGSIANLNVKRGKVGFAGEYKGEPTNNPAPAAPLGGSRPIDL